MRSRHHTSSLACRKTTLSSPPQQHKEILRCQPLNIGIGICGARVHFTCKVCVMLLTAAADEAVLQSRMEVITRIDVGTVQWPRSPCSIQIDDGCSSKLL